MIIGQASNNSDYIVVGTIKRGNWVSVDTTTNAKQCSVCGKVFMDVVAIKCGNSTVAPCDVLWDYCPKCGAYMRGNDK